MEHNIENIKIRILVPAALALLLVVVIAVSIIYKSQSQRALEASKVKSSQAHELLQHLLEVETKLLASLNNSARNNEALQQAWLAKDRQALLQHALPRFKEMLDEYNVTHFYFIGLDKKSFLRVHQPSRHGDVIERKTLLKAIRTGDVGAGLELGPMGTFTLRVVYPWHIKDKLVGYIEVGQEIHHTISKLHEVLDVDVFMLVKKNLLEQARWQQTMHEMGHDTNWDQFKDLVMISRTLKHAPALERDAYNEHLKSHTDTSYQPTPHFISDNEHEYSASFTPLIDAGDNDVGDMIVLSDITTEQTRLQAFTRILIVSSALIAAILFFSFYRYIGKIERQLVTSRRNLLKESESREAALLNAKNTAEETGRMKSQFLANMSHEIRTPMNGVMGMLQILNETPLSQEQEEYTKVAINSAASLISLVDDILDLSKMEAGKLTIEHIGYDVRTTVENVTESLYEGAYSKGLELSCLFDPEVPTQIMGDPTRLRQILNNLIGNAIKFTPKGEVIVHIGTSKTQDNQCMLRFEVTDTGIGISSEKLANIFQSFVQEDGSTTRQYGGTGLGLTITKNLVEQMGGQIRVKSDRGKGSSFYFTLPLEQLVDKPEQENVPFHNINGLHVLLVSNNPTIERILISLGLKSERIAIGDDVIGKLEAGIANDTPFSIAIIEQTEGINILEMAKNIKATRSIADTRLVLLTAFGHRGDGEATHHDGFEGLLTKPICQSPLYDCISTIMGRVNSDDKVITTKNMLAEEKTSEKTHILLAEDHTVNQIVVVSMLKKLGYQTDIAADGTQVLQALGNKKYQLILMDCQMPNMDGFEATNIIRNSTESWKHIPIIALTANALEGDKERCLQAGMNEYLTKPLNQEVLKEMLDSFIHGTDEQDKQAMSDIN